MKIGPHDRAGQHLSSQAFSQISIFGTHKEGDEITAAPFTDYGTRHRSAFRFVEHMAPSVAFILSQDGGIKAVTKVGERVVMWPYFELGYMTALS